jgi:uncharacterized membrane protein (UPF0127 family)
MIIKNLTRGTLVTSDLKEVRSSLDKSFGLLRKSNPRSLLFKTRFGIHTIGLRNAIDILILDNNLEVVKIGNNVKPSRIFLWNPKHKLVLELPQGAIKISKTYLKDKLEIA